MLCISSDGQVFNVGEIVIFFIISYWYFVVEIVVSFDNVIYLVCVLEFFYNYVMFCFYRRKVFEVCRGFKFLFNEARERVFKVFGFIKKFQNDFENVVKFSIDVFMNEFLMRLEVSG